MGRGVVGADRQRTTIDVDVGDGGDGAVADPETPLVPQRHDPIAGLVGAAIELEGRSGQLAGRVAMRPGAGVEVVDVVVTGRDHQHLLVA